MPNFIAVAGLAIAFSSAKKEEKKWKIVWQFIIVFLTVICCNFTPLLGEWKHKGFNTARLT